MEIGSEAPIASEVGDIPNNWRIHKIKDLASIRTGARNTQDRMTDGQYPFFVRSQTIERINTYSFDGEAVLTAGDGVGTGKVFHYINGKFDFHQRVYKISNFDPALNGYYFYLYFSNYFYDRIMKMTAKSSVDSVRLEMIADMPILVPPIEEQTAIATALNDADALIVALEKLIEKKRMIKQGVMQELLRPKEGWKKVRLGDVSMVSMGQSPNSTYYNTHAKGLALIQGNADIMDRKSIARVWTTHLTKVCAKGDLILTVRAPVGEVAVASEDSCIGRGVCSLRPFRVNAKFLYHLLVSRENRWKQFEQGSTFTSANSAQVKNFELDIPEEMSEQSRIADILDDIDSELVFLEERLIKQERMKTGMMQELLTGKTRLI